MAKAKLSELVAVAATPAVDDEVYIRDVSEDVADESKRITIANLIAAGLLTSRARAYLNAADLDVADAQSTIIPCDVEDFDGLGEFDNTYKTGAADATEANKLHDADASFAESDVGRTVYNTTDVTKAVVTAFVDSGELTLDTDIMANGESYIVGSGRFTATVTGYYVVLCNIRYVNGDVLADKQYGLEIRKNGTVNVNCVIQSSVAGKRMIVSTGGIIYLAATDYLEMLAFHEAGATTAVDPGTYNTFFSIHRLS